MSEGHEMQEPLGDDPETWGGNFPSKWRRIEGIISAFYSIPSPGSELSPVGSEANPTEQLAEAIRRGEWELIAEAAMVCAQGREAARHEALRMATMIYENPEDLGLRGKPTKGDILMILERIDPGIFSTIPPSESGKRAWWKAFEYEVAQSRGYLSSEMKQAARKCE